MLYVRRKKPRVRCEAVIHGGGHERGIAPDAERAGQRRVRGGRRDRHRRARAGSGPVAKLRDRLWSGITEKLDDVYRNGDPEHGLPHT